jgi:putative Holliday junction resolvase
VPIRLFDERMSTVTAHSMLRDSGRAGRGRRSIIDQAAATVILQTALDSDRTRASAPGESR